MLEEEPSPPDLHHTGIITNEVTSGFFKACKALSPGVIIKDGQFALFSAVSALEIMDPKMDSGYLTLGKSHAEVYDVQKSILPEEAIGIIDQLLCLEMAWHLGYPLSQTLFTSFYVDSITARPIHIQDLVSQQKTLDPLLATLRAYCIALIKTCFWVNEIIRSETFYEEEDFVTNTYHRFMLQNIDDSKIQQLVHDALERLHAVQSQFPPIFIQALESRLRFRNIFLETIMNRMRNTPKTSRTSWLKMERILFSIRESHPLAKPVPSAFSAKIQQHLASTVPPRPIVDLDFDDAYEHFCRLIKDSIEALDILNFKDTQSHLTFVQLFMARIPTPLVFVRGLLQGYLFRPDIFPPQWDEYRVLDEDLAVLVLPSSRLIDRAYDEIEATHDDRHFISQQMAIFRQRALFPFSELHRVWCQNRPRARRMMIHLLHEWDLVQQEAEEIDGSLLERLKETPMPNNDGSPPSYALPLSSWAYYYKCRVMEWILQLGFELEIYQAHEMAGMYYFLNILSRLRSSHLERIKSFTLAALRDKQAEVQSSLFSTDFECFDRSLNWLRMSTLDAAITWEFSDALAALYTVLLRLGLVNIPPRPYGSEELRHELRFRPWSGISFPQVPEHSAFKEEWEKKNESINGILSHAEKAIFHAKKGFEVVGKLPENDKFCHNSHGRWTTWYKDAQKAAIMAGIAIANVKGAYTRALKTRALSSQLVQSGVDANVKRNDFSLLADKISEPTVEELRLKIEVPSSLKAYHSWWIVPSIVPIK